MDAEGRREVGPAQLRAVTQAGQIQLCGALHPGRRRFPDTAVMVSQLTLDTPLNKVALLTILLTIPRGNQATAPDIKPSFCAGGRG